MNPIGDTPEHRARRLETALRARGIPCSLHQDHSPSGVRIPLVEHPSLLGRDITPALFVLTEGTQLDVLHREVWVWAGCLAGFGAGDDTLVDTRLRMA